MKTSLALLLALAIISVDSKHLKLGCYVGSADNYLIKHGFDSCVAIHNISENSITLMGLHKNTALEEAFSSEGMTSDCVLRLKTTKQFVVSCQCFTTMCNIPRTGEQLLEHGFDVDSDY